MSCNMDCFNCPYPDCINDSTPEKREYRRNYMREWRKSNPERYERIKARMRILNQQRRDRLKAQGICTSCGKVKTNGTIRCPECARKNAESSRINREKKRKAV